jgi:hypothetical protein
VVQLDVVDDGSAGVVAERHTVRWVEVSTATAQGLHTYCNVILLVLSNGGNARNATTQHPTV